MPISQTLKLKPLRTGEELPYMLRLAYEYYDTFLPVKQTLELDKSYSELLPSNVDFVGLAKDSELPYFTAVVRHLWQSFHDQLSKIPHQIIRYTVQIERDAETDSVTVTLIGLKTVTISQELDRGKLVTAHHYMYYEKQRLKELLNGRTNDMQDLFDEYAPSRNPWNDHRNRGGKPAFNIKIHKLPSDLQDYWFELAAKDTEGFELGFIFDCAVEDAFEEFITKHYTFSRMGELIRTDGRSGGWLVLNDSGALIANECDVWEYENYILDYVRAIQKYVQPKLRKHRYHRVPMRYSAKVRAAYQVVFSKQKFSWPVPRGRNGKRYYRDFLYPEYVASVIGTYEFFWEEDLSNFRDKYRLLLDWQKACESFVECYKFHLQDHKDQQLEENTEHASNPDL